MAITMTLADSLQLTHDTLQAGIIETLGTESKILAVLPFMNVEGQGYSFNVETKLSDTQFRAVGEAITPGTAGYETRTETLKILGDEAIVDTFQRQVLGNVTDLMALEVGLKVKAMAHKFEKTFISGDETSNPKEFTGIEKRVIPEQRITPGDDLFTDLRKLRNKVQGTPSVYLMNKDTLVEYEAQYKNFLTWSRNEFGVPVAAIGGIPVLDLDNEILPASGGIYALRFAPKEGVCGLTNGGVQVKALGEVDHAPQLLTRMEFFCGLAVFNDFALAKIDTTPVPAEDPETTEG